MAFGFTRKERIYCPVETTFGVAAAAAAGNAVRHISVQLTPTVERIDRPDKNGLRSIVPGTNGRRGGSFAVSMSMVPGSAAGSDPDADAFYQSLFGQAGTTVASTSHTYNLSDAVKSFNIWRYRDSGLIQQVGLGCVARTFRAELGQNVALANFGGPLMWVLDSEELADLTDGDVGKGGLTGTTWATEPTPTYNGNMVAGYKGAIQFDGDTIAEFQSGSISIDNGIELVYAHGSDYPRIAIGGTRRVECEWRLYDNDTAASKALYALGKTKTPIDLIWDIGDTAGARMQFTVRGVQVAMPDIAEDGERFVQTYASSPASVSGATPNEVELKFY